MDNISIYTFKSFKKLLFFYFKAFQLSMVSIVMMTIAGLGFLINCFGAVYLSLKIKDNKSPFLR